MQTLRLSDPKERQGYSKSHRDGNVVLHPTAGAKTDLRSAGGRALEVPRIGHDRVNWRWLFAAAVAAFAIS
jgi:hypothetical protein